MESPAYHPLKSIRRFLDDLGTILIAAQHVKTSLWQALQAPVGSVSLEQLAHVTELCHDAITQIAMAHEHGRHWRTLPHTAEDDTALQQLQELIVQLSQVTNEAIAYAYELQPRTQEVVALAQRLGVDIEEISSNPRLTAETYRFRQITRLEEFTSAAIPDHWVGVALDATADSGPLSYAEWLDRVMSALRARLGTEPDIVAVSALYQRIAAGGALHADLRIADLHPTFADDARGKAYRHALLHATLHPKDGTLGFNKDEFTRVMRSMLDS